MGRAKLYDVWVEGYGASIEHATSAGACKARVWNTDPFSHITFKDFLRICRVKRRTEPVLDDGYGYVRRQYGVDLKLGQRVELPNGYRGEVVYPGPCTAHVHVIIDGGTYPRIWHPSDVTVLPPPAPHTTEAGR